MRSSALHRWLVACVSVALPFAPTGASAAPTPARGLDPCTVVTKRDIRSVLDWSVTAMERKVYRLPAASGRMCQYQANEGSVVITVPDAGSSFLQNNTLVDPFANGLGTRVGGLAASAQLFNGTAYIAKGERSVSVQVLPNGYPVSARELTRFARVAARRLP
jgi:hypothetical protein